MKGNNPGITRIFKGSLYATALLLPLLVPSIHNKLVILLAFIWLLGRPRVWPVLKSDMFLQVFVGLFILMVAGLAYTSNLQEGLAAFDDALILLVLPLVILTGKPWFTYETTKRVLVFFLIGVVILNLTSLFFISFDAWDAAGLQSKLIAANEVIARIHPAYTSIYISLAIFFLIDQYFPLPTQERNRLGWTIFGLVVLSTYLLWLNSRAGILSFFLASVFFIVYRWKGALRLVGLAGLVFFIGVIVAIPFSRYRFVNAPLKVFSSPVSSTVNDPDLYPLATRMEILKCNMALVKWPQILYGYGTGDHKDALWSCFEEQGYVVQQAQHMNQHNEYFAQLQRHGIFGLGLFLALLILPFRQALKYKSPLLGAFIILFAVTAFFENVFSAQKGVTFFAFFCPLLWLFACQAFDRKQVSEQNNTG